MVRWLRAGMVAVALAGMIALSGVVLGRIYADGLLVQLVAGAAVGSVAVGLAAWRLPSWAVAPISVLLLAAYTVLALTVAAGRAGLDEPLRDMVADSVGNGIPRLLTAMIPVESTPDTVVVPVVAAWLAGLAGAEAAVRGRRVLLGCLPAAAVFGGALYVVGPNAGAAGWPTVAFAGLVVVALAVSNRAGPGVPLAEVPAKTRAAVRGRAVLAAVAGLVLVGGLAGVVGPWVGARVSATPVDPRRYVEPPQVDSLDESPLNRISGWALEPEQKLLEVGPTGIKGRTRLRLAVLPDYDGVTWRVGATYRNAGRVLPTPVPPADTPSVRVRQEITVDGLTGRLLPVVPTPTAVQGARVAYDVDTGTLIRPEGLTRGLRYTVTSQVLEPDPNLLPGADTPDGDAVARYLRVGAGAPADLQRLADQLADGNGAAYDRAVAIEDFLAEHYRKVPDAPSGHAYPNLRFFLFGPRNQGGQAGTSEQFAASFAVLARLTGLPSRVVVGFDAPARGGTVTGGDALAWPEVLFEGLGWVAFDPLPRSKEAPRPVEEDFTPRPSPTPSTVSEVPPVSESASAPAPAAVAVAEPGGGVPGVVWGGAGSGAVLVLLGVLAAVGVGLRRGLRRRRLTEGGPDERIVGAWLEFTDALRLAGRAAPGYLAASEVAAYAEMEGEAGAGRGVLRRAAPGQGGGQWDLGWAQGPPVAEPSGAEPSGAERTHEDGSGAGVPDSVWAGAGAGAGGTVTVVAPVVQGAGRRVAAPLDELVAGVNAVAFASGNADEGQAQRAGAQAVAYAEGLRARQPWWRRWWWSVRPGPLRWHR